MNRYAWKKDSGPRPLRTAFNTETNASEQQSADYAADAFIRVIQYIRSGRAVVGKFRPYLATVVRNVAVDAHRGQRGREWATDDIASVLPHGLVIRDPQDRVVDRGLVRQAVQDLPDRWRSILWRIDVIGEPSAHIAKDLGVSPNSISALAYRARTGLRMSYLRCQLDRPANAECASLTDSIIARALRRLTTSAGKPLDEHLSDCSRCRQRMEQATAASSRFAAIGGPLLLVVYLGRQFESIDGHGDLIVRGAAAAAVGAAGVVGSTSTGVTAASATSAAVAANTTATSTGAAANASVGSAGASVTAAASNGSGGTIGVGKSLLPNVLGHGAGHAGLFAVVGTATAAVVISALIFSQRSPQMNNVVERPPVTSQPTPTEPLTPTPSPVATTPEMPMPTSPVTTVPFVEPPPSRPVEHAKPILGEVVEERSGIPGSRNYRISVTQLTTGLPLNAVLTVDGPSSVTLASAGHGCAQVDIHKISCRVARAGNGTWSVVVVVSGPTSDTPNSTSTPQAGSTLHAAVSQAATESNVDRYLAVQLRVS